MMGINLLTVKNAHLKAGRRVLLRADFNVPVNDRGEIIDDKRIADSLVTIKYCLQKQVRLVICSHFGRPEGKREPQYSLRPVYERLQRLLPAVKITFADDCVGAEVERQVATLGNGEILLLENTRFHAGEADNDADFARQLANLGDIFVNDAFGATHRAHASIVGVTTYLPSYAGFLLAREVKYLSHLTKNPERPFTVIMGGKKIADKLPLVTELADIADYILVGGKLASEWQPLTTEHHAQILVAKNATNDITPDTVDEWTDIINRSKTIFWNGPLGRFEDPQYALGTQAVATLLTHSHALTVAGGGDTAAAVKEFRFDHVSTGGGAALEFLQGAVLPGLACLPAKGGK